MAKSKAQTNETNGNQLSFLADLVQTFPYVKNDGVNQ